MSGTSSLTEVKLGEREVEQEGAGINLSLAALVCGGHATKVFRLPLAMTSLQWRTVVRKQILSPSSCFCQGVSSQGTELTPSKLARLCGTRAGVQLGVENLPSIWKALGSVPSTSEAREILTRYSRDWNTGLPK